MIFPNVTTYYWLCKNYTFVEGKKLDERPFGRFLRSNRAGFDEIKIPFRHKVLQEMRLRPQPSSTCSPCRWVPEPASAAGPSPQSQERGEDRPAEGRDEDVVDADVLVAADRGRDREEKDHPAQVDHQQRIHRPALFRSLWSGLWTRTGAKPMRRGVASLLSGGGIRASRGNDPLGSLH